MTPAHDECTFYSTDSQVFAHDRIQVRSLYICVYICEGRVYIFSLTIGSVKAVRRRQLNLVRMLMDTGATAILYSN